MKKKKSLKIHLKSKLKKTIFIREFGHTFGIMNGMITNKIEGIS